MVFKLSQAALDIVSGFATVTALDTPPPGPGAGKPKMVQVQALGRHRDRRGMSRALR